MDHDHDHDHAHHHQQHDHSHEGDESHIHDGHEEEVKAASYADNEMISGRPTIVAPGSVLETGQVSGNSPNAGANRQTLSGNVDQAQVRENLVGTAPATVSNPAMTFQPVDYTGGTGTGGSRLDDGDGMVDPATRTPVAGQPEYQAIHHDTSTPDYRDETYRRRGEQVLDPESGTRPDPSPKENTGY